MIVLRKPATQTVPDGLRSGVVVADFLSGAINGMNQTYQTTYNYIPNRITVYYNGQALHSPWDFQQTGDNEIEFIYITPAPGEKLRATYEVEGSRPGTYITGEQALSIGDLSKTVYLGTTLSGTDYRINSELVTTDGSPCVYSYVIGNKTTSSFTIYLSGVMDTNNYTLEWMVYE